LESFGFGFGFGWALVVEVVGLLGVGVVEVGVVVAVSVAVPVVPGLDSLSEAEPATVSVLGLAGAVAVATGDVASSAAEKGASVATRATPSPTLRAAARERAKDNAAPGCF